MTHSKIDHEVKSLTKPQLKEVAPAIFSKVPSPSVSDKYAQFSTEALIDDMKKFGWVPVEAKQSKTRVSDKNPYALHVVTFENPNVSFKSLSKEAWPRIIIRNSHNGRNRFQFMFGLIRLVCMNGLVSGELQGELNVIHKFYSMEALEDSISEYLKTIPDQIKEIDKFKSVKLSSQQQVAFARKVLSLKYSDVKNAPITTEHLLSIRRKEDESDDLWTIMNVIQENFMKGGLRGQTASGRFVTSKPIQNVFQIVDYNMFIWNLAAQYASK